MGGRLFLLGLVVTLLMALMPLSAAHALDFEEEIRRQERTNVSYIDVKLRWSDFLNRRYKACRKYKKRPRTYERCHHYVARRLYRAYRRYLARKAQGEVNDGNFYLKLRPKDS